MRVRSYHVHHHYHHGPGAGQLGPAYSIHSDGEIIDARFVFPRHQAATNTTSRVPRV